MPRTDWPRTILHVDLDAFYTSVHQRDDTFLRNRPLAVAGRSKRAVVMGASYEARSHGVHSAQPLHEALERCPGLTVVPPDPARYKDASRRVHAIFRRLTTAELIEGVALDEAYLDVTVRSRHAGPEEIGRRIKFAIQEEVKLTASVGVATSKLLAKVAGASRKPDGLVIVQPGQEASFLGPLPVGVVPGLGPKTEERLRLMGVRTVGELADYDTQRLLQAFGSSGAMLQRLAQGRDRNPVRGAKPAQTISAERTFEDDITDREQLEVSLRELVQSVAERLRGDLLQARTVYIKLKLTGYGQLSRQVSQTSPTDDPESIFRAALSALRKSYFEDRPVRLLGVGVSGLKHPQPQLQLTLFE
ncbi:MAG: DNA polymerase IV [Candidatus Dormibacteraeota bacterium]|uniref:DNA polymerase IV n=1 Tax=Candidatus Dormiibacter inghamiae TaxID=3127013 RepID=A0A934NC68_9BACT|nr:DNA polymerase IV [Candidatus Dormibacteraeota bacterium]MBJ7605904.1 DNA polymerase IV [Candidatus Dormibacteraeota bacterium]